ncbi:Protein LAS1 [Ceratocystis platani]|uniref:Protein LAS1 n=1 Tax=Ceratocystis fimbriata f. sp. platani TaxID=88771 RepID=A0A0F8B0V8_CERFI|nr:Protein LAS1 [Ceratocystis platani]
MVQYVFTPWRDAVELEQVKRAFYPEASLSRGSGGPASTQDASCTQQQQQQQQQQRHEAVDRVAMWMQRGNCPHMIESTALLTAAIIADEEQQQLARGPGAGLSEYAMRAAYSTSFSRFVTGLLDGQQDKLRKMSMFSLAKNIGLPATFVELRHQATHEPLPSLSRLRAAARKALVWIWEYYWMHLPLVDIEEVTTTVAGPETWGSQGNHMVQKALPTGAQQEVLCFLESREAMEPEAREQMAAAWVQKWGVQAATRVVNAVNETATQRQVMLRAIQMSRAIEQFEGEVAEEDGQGDERQGVVLERGQMGHDMPTDLGDEDGEDGCGWTVYAGKWKAKPIGAV